MADLDPVALNVQGVTQLVGSDLNKVHTGKDGNLEGESGERVDVLALSMSDEQLLELRDDWESQYVGYEARIKAKQQKNKQYYLGKQNEGTPYVSDDVIAANLQWEAAETFYPAALSKNPEPVVYCDNSPEGNALASDVKTMLAYHADYLDLRALLTLQTRQWSIYYLGVKKWGWDAEINEVTCSVRRIQNFIFDTKGYVDTKGHFVGYLGERIEVSAERLADLFPEHKQYISDSVGGQMGTPVVYTEWWTDEFCFITYKEKVLDKHKNEFFNYGQDTEDEYGLPVELPGQNHFAKPLKPYTFLSVYSLGEQPHDITGLIEQNIPNQNRITKRTNQIDSNISKGNNSDIFSENNFNQETAKQAADALKKGNPVLIPSGGPIGEAIVRLQAPGFPDAAFKELEIDKETLRNSWGVQGITATPPDEDQTARGMILNTQHDNSRIGGGIGEAIERVAKADFNWLVQLYAVFYDEIHFGAVLGTLKATEYVTLRAANLNKKLIVTVVPDSMRPKDDITKMNQALTLWQEGALDIKTLLTILDFPDPQQTAAQVWLWRTNPMLYGQLNFPDLQQLLAPLMQQIAPQTTPGTPPSEAVPGQPGQGQPFAQNAPGGESVGGVPSNPSLSQVPLPK